MIWSDLISISPHPMEKCDILLLRQSLIYITLSMEAHFAIAVA